MKTSTFNSWCRRWKRRRQFLCSAPQRIAYKSLACVDIKTGWKMLVLNFFHSSHIWLNSTL